MADSRERDANDLQDSSYSSDSQVAFGSDKPFSNHLIGGGGGSMVPIGLLPPQVDCQS